MKRFLRDTKGATAIEYCLIASLIGLLLIGSLTSIGGSLTTMLQGLMVAFGG